MRLRTGIEINRKVWRVRVSYANVAATLALVAAIGGGTAWAANTAHARPRPRSHAKKHYAITSTSQIKPSVLKALKGARGKSGVAGATGTQGGLGSAGPAGASGATGAAGAGGAAGSSGTDGAVAGYSATGSSTVIPSGSNTGTLATVVSKSLPAGHYIVAAQADLTAQASVMPAIPGVEEECALFAGGSNVASVVSASAIAEYHFTTDEFLETSIVPVQAPVDLVSTATVSLQCELLLPLSGDQATGFANSATSASLTAVETSSNG